MQKKVSDFWLKHCQFPKEVWQLFDKKLDICADSSRLKETFPAEFINGLVQMCTRKERFDYSLLEGEDGGDYDSFFHCCNDCWNTLAGKDYEKVRRLVDSADGTGIYHPYLEIVKVLLCRNTGQNEEAGSG